MKTFKEFAEACDFLDQNTEGTKKFIKKHGLKKHDVPEKAGTENQFKSNMSKAKNGGYEGEEDEKAYEDNNNPVITNRVIPKKLADTFRVQSESSIDLDAEGIELDEETQLIEVKLGPAQKIKRDLIYKRLKSQLFKYRKYGKKARSKMYSDATKQARGITEEDSHDKTEMKILKRLEKKTDSLIKKDKAVHKKLEEEQLDELSADTLKSYSKKASGEVNKIENDTYHNRKTGENRLGRHASSSVLKKYTNRLDGIKRADKKAFYKDNPTAVREEELSELSLDTLKSYRKKAEKAPANLDRANHDEIRFKGIDRANSKIGAKSKALSSGLREETLKIIAEKILYSAISEERFTDEDLELMISDLEELLSMEGDE